MPTALDLEQPKVEDVKASIATPAKAASQKSASPPLPERSFQRTMFSDSLLETDSPERRRRGLAATLSFAFQCVLVGILLIVPLMFTEALPTQQLLTFLVAPPPPPPPPPPAAVQVTKVVQTNMLNGGQLRTPTQIPKKVEMIREEEAPPPAMGGGVVGGIPGGIPGGQLSGVIGGIISASANSRPMVPRLEPVTRVRISQGVTQGMVVKKVEPSYPKIAHLTSITGVVLVKAVINTKGEITEAQAVTGHPFLVPAALDAVKQWHYRPYLLSGVPVEVETFITVTFKISP